MNEKELPSSSRHGPFDREELLKHSKATFDAERFSPETILQSHEVRALKKKRYKPKADKEKQKAEEKT